MAQFSKFASLAFRGIEAGAADGWLEETWVGIGRRERQDIGRADRMEAVLSGFYLPRGATQIGPAGEGRMA
jgi:hypothetical protein